MNEKIRNTIDKLLKERFQEEDLKDCFLFDVSKEGKKINVFVDGDEFLTLRRCQRISRFLESHLDEDKSIPDDYTLDVSSPGLTNPLKLFRQYKKHTGKPLKVTLNNNETLEGVLMDVLNESRELIIEIVEKKVKSSHTISFENVKESFVILPF